MMAYIEHISKELAEYLRRRVLRFKVGKTPNDIQKILANLQHKGIHVIENYWSDESCLELTSKIDKAISTDQECLHWTDAEGADHRIWEAEKLSASFAEFLNDPFIEKIRKYYSGILIDEKLLLAARLTFTSGNLGSGGGWHRDSPHSLQFKAILYLSDVKVESGPFEYFEQSHSEWSSIQLLQNQLCKANQFRFTNEDIEKIESSQAIICSSKPFLANKGTLLLVNTKGIHRGRPIQQGYRYALTQYCFNGDGKSDFLKKLELSGGIRH